LMIGSLYSERGKNGSAVFAFWNRSGDHSYF
jgi:hypothetical protein